MTSIVPSDVNSSATDPHPSPMLFFETANAYQQTAALKAAVDLGLFTAVGEAGKSQGGATAAEIAPKCQASVRGVRILCDYLVILGFLTKTGERYALTPDSALFLDQNSRAYLGGALGFLNAPQHMDAFQNLAEAVRKGGTTLPGRGSVEPENAVWEDFARAMMPMMMGPARMIAERVACDPGRKTKVLDIAAGHGVFGIVLAQQNPNVEVVALDWPPVLHIARENAQKMGVGDRYATLPGSAFEVDFGTGYDLVLLTNFLHHFDPPTCEGLLRKVHAALAENGRAVTVEFVVNADRISPPETAMFSLVMLAATPAGDAYTFAEIETMFRNAGFGRTERHALRPSPEEALISYKS